MIPNPETLVVLKMQVMSHPFVQASFPYANQIGMRMLEKLLTFELSRQGVGGCVQGLGEFNTGLLVVSTINSREAARAIRELLLEHLKINSSFFAILVYDDREYVWRSAHPPTWDAVMVENLLAELSRLKTEIESNQARAEAVLRGLDHQSNG